MVRVKICGITRLEDAMAAVEYGADAVGFVFAESPRRITPDKAAGITAQLPPLVYKVGVFVDCPLAEVKRVASLCKLNAVQLHGSESADYCAQLFPSVIKAFRVRDESVLKLLPSYKTGAYLLDGFSPAGAGGTGARFNWDIASKAKSFGRIILSGGLTPENVFQAITEVKPYAVDAASGVETAPGIKDREKMYQFIKAAKSLGGD